MCALHTYIHICMAMYVHTNAWSIYLVHIHGWMHVIMTWCMHACGQLCTNQGIRFNWKGHTRYSSRTEKSSMCCWSSTGRRRAAGLKKKKMERSRKKKTEMARMGKKHRPHFDHKWSIGGIWNRPRTDKGSAGISDPVGPQGLSMVGPMPMRTMHHYADDFFRAPLDPDGMTMCPWCALDDGMVRMKP